MMRTIYSALLLLLIITTITIVSTAKHQPPAATTPRSSPLHHYQPPQPPATRPASPSPPQQHQLNNIIDALVGAGDFSGWTSMILSASDMFILPLSATLFVPSDHSLLPYSVPTSTTTTTSATVSYHIVPQRLTFSQLTLFKPSSRLPTLLPSRSILLTNTCTSNFTLDGSRLSHPDLYLTSAIAVHGIDGLLNYTVYGGLHVPQAPLPPPPPPLHGDVIGWRQRSVGGRLLNWYGDFAFVLSFISWVVFW